MSKTVSNIVQFTAVAALGLASFGATAYAASTATAAEESLLDMLKPVYDAFRGGHYIGAGALTVIFAVALLKRYAPGRLRKFVYSDLGGTLSAFLVAAAGSVAASSPDASWSWSILSTAFTLGLAGAGGYTVIKKVLVDRLLASTWYNTKAPSWIKMGLRVVLWVFAKPASEAAVLAAAEKAGQDAVAAEPSRGVDGFVPPAEKF